MEIHTYIHIYLQYNNNMPENSTRHAHTSLKRRRLAQKLNFFLLATAPQTSGRCAWFSMKIENSPAPEAQRAPPYKYTHTYIYLVSFLLYTKYKRNPRRYTYMLRLKSQNIFSAHAIRHMRSLSVYI